ncbi:hypothetical protein CDD81_3137 [Ophiocordyceps australis]|uniref:Uncharacterized protein n=1 Tax=Ophiocordyceps australis TaxID=1399860 RepID=A0A2C5XSQ6_9HYPO|nr:hypothetical protein CDD81_3137 [Ophiocordyceps australis]
MAACPEQVDSFKRNGFLIVKDFLSPDETRDLQKWAQQVHDMEPSDTSDFMPYEVRVCRFFLTRIYTHTLSLSLFLSLFLSLSLSLPLPLSLSLSLSLLSPAPLPQTVAKTAVSQEVNDRGERVLCRTENFADGHSGFNALLRGDRLLQLVGSLSGEAMSLFKEKINYKLSGSGGFAPHIDANAYNHIKKVKHLTVLLSVDQSSQANGCLEVVPGSHEMDIPLDETTRCIQDGWVQSQAWKSIELEPALTPVRRVGQLVVFTSYLAHRSGANRSKHSRRAIYATYNCASEGDLHQEYYAHRKKEWPATHMRKAGERYERGALVYAYGSPMLSVETGHQVAF